jgi:hypothetical protein
VTPSPTPRFVLVAWYLMACACGSTKPSAVTLEGQWTGTTAQGTPIAFTVAADQKVTSVTVAYSFNGCTGTHSAANLSLETSPNLICVPGPCAPSLTSYRAFNYSTGRIDGPSTTVNAVFVSTGRAEGQAAFRDYPGCGTVTGVSWSAAKR